MDNEEFLKKLSELTEWHRPEFGPNGSKSVSKRTKDVPEIIEECVDELEENKESEPQGPNESVPPVIIRLKPQKRNCDDCECVVTDRRVERKLHHTNKPHWREYCTACKLYKDPRTGRFELTAKQSQMIYQTVTRGQGKYRSKYQKHTIDPVYEYKTVETAQGFTRILVEKTDADK
jgi:hypothetical protein